MNRIVEKTQEPYLKKEITSFNPGDTIRVHVRLKEGEEKERIQPFEGVVISRRAADVGDFHCAARKFWDRSGAHLSTAFPDDQCD